MTGIHASILYDQAMVLVRYYMKGTLVNEFEYIYASYFLIPNKSQVLPPFKLIHNIFITQGFLPN